MLDRPTDYVACFGVCGMSVECRGWVDSFWQVGFNCEMSGAATVAKTAGSVTFGFYNLLKVAARLAWLKGCRFL